MTVLKYLLGCPDKSPGYNTTTFKITGSGAGRNGFYRQRNSEAGMPVVVEMNPMTRFVFAVDIRGSTGLILGK